AGAVGAGRLGPDARLTGAAPPVRVSPVAAASASSPAAPLTLAGGAARIPGGGAARVRVEKYTMRDGSRQFAVYVAGMQSMAFGGDDPWDNESNVQLYRGETSASYAATVEALHAAGAGRGDVVHAFGFSQGGMITAHLALEGEFDVATLVSFGSPVEADAGAGTVSASIRHTDDPVAALAAGGQGGSVGAAGSFVAETSFDPATGVHDATIPAHRLDAYVETAARVADTGDPRVQALERSLAGLSEAVSVEATEYAATRGR
ncbi:MAG: hypothetical protein QM602_11895, partial [Microbacterium sp.]